MAHSMIVVPEGFAVDTITREGEAGRAWIEALPGLVDAMCRRWGLQVDGRVMNGYLGVAVPVRCGEELCILKVSWLGEFLPYEVAALRAWDGHGAVRLLESDIERGAMLLERLDYSKSLNDVGIEEAMGVAGRLLRRLSIQAPEGIPLLRDRGEEMHRDFPERWENAGRPMSRRLLDQARELAVELGRACKRNLLVNYDLHCADVLAGKREPWLAVDPMVVAGDPEYGIAQLLWTRLEEIRANGGLDRQFPVLVESAELDPDLARGWALVRCVDYWLWGLSVGLTYDPARCEVITGWLSHPPSSYTTVPVNC